MLSVEPGLSSNVCTSAAIQPSGSESIDGRLREPVKRIVQRTEDRLRLSVGDAVDKPLTEVPLKRLDDDECALVERPRRINTVTIVRKRVLQRDHGWTALIALQRRIASRLRFNPNPDARRSQ